MDATERTTTIRFAEDVVEPEPTRVCKECSYRFISLVNSDHERGVRECCICDKSICDMCVVSPMRGLFVCWKCYEEVAEDS